MDIAVIQCTRGMIFSDAQSALEKNLWGYRYRIFRSSTLPIPECQNILVDQALAWEPSYLLFVEEDVVMPELALAQMMREDQPIVCIDYSVAGYGCVCTEKKTQEVLWCGLGCTLIKREVFLALEKPYFRTDIALRLNDWSWQSTNPDKVYGGQDIYFFCMARDKGYTIAVLPGECRHLRLRELGKREINNGLHQIEDKEPITKQNIIVEGGE